MHKHTHTTDPDGCERYGSLDELPIAALMCAAMGHAWEIVRDTEQDGTEYRCVRDGRVKVEWLDATGDHYHSPRYGAGALLHRNITAERRAAKLVLRRRLREGERQPRRRRASHLSTVTA